MAKSKKDKDQYSSFENLGGDLNVSKDLELDINNWEGTPYLVGGTNPGMYPFNDRDFKDVKGLANSFTKGEDLQSK
jgi:hypothetical protein